MENNKEAKKPVDGIKSGSKQKEEAEPSKAIREVDKPKNFLCEVMDYKVLKRGIWWYVIFFLAFIISGAASIYFMDWVLLSFIVIFSGYTLFRGLKGNSFEFEITGDGIRINQKIFLYGQIESYFFTYDEKNATITFQMMKKIYPKLTFILPGEKDIATIRQNLEAKIPETEPRDESWSDFIIRELKL